MKPYFINECSTLGKHGKFYVIVPATGPVRAFHADTLDDLLRHIDVFKVEVAYTSDDLNDSSLNLKQEDKDNISKELPAYKIDTGDAEWWTVDIDPEVEILKALSRDNKVIYNLRGMRDEFFIDASVIECMCRFRKDEVMKAIGDLAENYLKDEEKDDDV